VDAQVADTVEHARARVNVWIRPDTPERYRAMLPAGVEVHELPPPDGQGRVGPADFVVADFNRQGFLEVLPRLDGLRVVQTMSAGVDDLVGHIPNGVTLCDAAGVHDASVADWTVMAILAMHRRFQDLVAAQLDATWRRPDFRQMRDLDGLTVLIVGYGSIGRALESRLAPFGVTVRRVARTAREGVSDVGDLPKLLPEAEVVVILLPLTAATERFVDEKFLAAMRQGALLVNPARGRLVDHDALMRTLEQRRIRAALDVTDPEPLPDGHPLWKMEGVLITPHIAGSVAGVYERAWRLVADQVGRYVKGEPLLNVVKGGY
jgi:phosphoglycerate dehydrogenase-like enzyme